jgi:hypothetical protein
MSVSYCDGGCRTYDATSAECSDARQIEGRTFYRCTIDYEGGYPTAEVCAAYVPTVPGGAQFREKC